LADETFLHFHPCGMSCATLSTHTAVRNLRALYHSDFMEEEPCTSDDMGTPPLLKKLVGDGQDFVEGETVIARSQDGKKPCDKWELYKLPSTVLERWGDCFGIFSEILRLHVLMQ
jgi:hypothetical protein